MPPIHYPEMVYDCVMCGRSCRQAWSITVDPELQPPIEASPGAERARQRGYLPLTVEQPVQVGRDEEGCCSLLNEEGLCSIHADLGFEAKPFPCRQFPFHPIPSPGGFYLGMSFVCTAVQQSLGRPVQEHAPQVEQLVENLIVRHSLEDGAELKVPVDQERTVPWAEYLDFEQRLSSQLQPDLLEPMLIHAAFAVAEENPLPPRLAFVEMVTNMVLASVVCLIEERTPGENRTVISEAFSEGRSFFSPRLQRQVEPILFEPAFREQTLRYLRHVLFRKFLIQGDMVGRTLFLAVVVKALDYYAHQTADLKGRRTPTQEDYFEGLGLVERDVMLHAEGVETMHGLMSHGFRMALTNFPSPTN